CRQLRSDRVYRGVAEQAELREGLEVRWMQQWGVEHELLTRFQQRTAERCTEQQLLEEVPAYQVRARIAPAGAVRDRRAPQEPVRSANEVRVADARSLMMKPGRIVELGAETTLRGDHRALAHEAIEVTGRVGHGIVLTLAVALPEKPWVGGGAVAVDEVKTR